LVETTAVQAVAVQRSPGDSLAMDRSSSSNSMGLVFDLISLAAKPGAAPADVSAQPDAPKAAANGNAVTLPSSDSSIPSPSGATMLPTIGDGPISVDALVAMDKTARQGLTAKPFIEKPAVEWMISVLSAAGLVKNAPDGSKTLTQAADALSAHLTGEAPTAEAPSSQIGETGLILTVPTDTTMESPIAPLRAPVGPVEPHAFVAEEHPVSEVEVSTLAIVADVKAAEQVMPAPIAAPEMAKAVESSSEGVKSISVDHREMGLSIVGPEIPAEPSPMAAAPAMTGMNPLPTTPVSGEVNAALPAPVQSNSSIAQVAAIQPQVAAPVAAAMAKSVPAPPDVNRLPVEPSLSTTQQPQHDDSVAPIAMARPLVEQPPIEGPKPAMPVDAGSVASAPLVADVNEIALPAKGVLATPATPLTQEGDETAAANTDVVPPTPLMMAKKADHSSKAKVAEKATVSTDTVAATNIPVLPLPIAVQETNVTPAAAEPTEMSEQEGLRPLGSRAKTVLSTDPALTDDPAAPPTAKSPLAPSRPSFDGQMTEKGQPSQTQASGPAQPISVPEQANNSAEPPAPLTLTPHVLTGEEAHLLHQAAPQKPVFEGNGPMEARQPSSAAPLADQSGSGAEFENSSSNQQSLPQNFDQSNGSSASSHPLPDHVTVESVSIGSQHSTHEDAPSNATLNATTADQTAPLSVFTDAEPTKMSGSEFLSRPSTTSANGGSSATSTAPAAASPIRVDNPIFIAQRDKALQQQIISALRSGHDEIRLSLYPPQLGQVTINMALDGQKVKVGVKTANREATNLLVGERQSLAQALGHEGFTLEGFDVTDDAPKERSPEHELTEHLIPNSQMAAESSFSLDITI